MIVWVVWGCNLLSDSNWIEKIFRKEKEAREFALEKNRVERLTGEFYSFAVQLYEVV